MVRFLLCLASFLQFEGVACVILLAIYFVCMHVQAHKCVCVCWWCAIVCTQAEARGRSWMSFLGKAIYPLGVNIY